MAQIIEFAKAAQPNRFASMHHLANRSILSKGNLKDERVSLVSC